MALKAGSTYQSILRPENVAWTPMGTTGQNAEVMGVVEPDDNSAYVNFTKARAQEQATDLSKQKFDLLSGLLKGYKSNFAGSIGAPANNVPAPNYMAYQPVYTQQQINAQAGLQRANLLNQADQQTRQFGQQMASRGFSPMSPYSMLAGQSNTMRANAGAAANETKLNFDAATANSDARIKTGGINAGIYGSYAGAIGQQNSLNTQWALQTRAQDNDIYKLLLSGLIS